MSDMFKPVDTTLPVENNFWARCKAFWLQDAETWLSQDAEVVLDRAWKKICNFFCGTEDTISEGQE